MDQLFLFPDLELPLRVLLNQGGVDIHDIPELDFTLEEGTLKPNKARKIKTEKMSLIKNIEKGKYIIFPTGAPHAGEKYEHKGDAFPYVYNTKRDRKLPVRLSRCKYPTLTVCIGSGKTIDWLAHELFALAFVENNDPKAYYMVDHIDDDHLNYKLSNLCWISGSDNQKKAALKKKNLIKYIDDYII